MQTQTSHSALRSTSLNMLPRGATRRAPCRGVSAAAAPAAQAAVDPERCAREYAPLVKQIARYVVRAMPRSVDLNDLIQLGMMGLLEAAKRYNRVAAASFATFAAKRIRGAILDGLRRADPTPRRTRDHLRLIDTATRKLEHDFQRRPSESEIAAELGWTQKRYRAVLQRALEHQQVYWEDVAASLHAEPQCSAQEADPLAQMLDAETVATLRAEIEQLPERERKVLDLYYFKELKLREIGSMLGLSEARVCQMLRKAIDCLRARMQPKCAMAT